MQVDDLEPQLVEFGLQVNPRQPGQLTKLHVQDVVRLNLGEFKGCRHQAVTSDGDVVAGPDQLDDFVDDIEGLDAPLEDVFAMPGLLQPVLGTPGDDLDLVLQVGNKCVAEVDLARHSPDQGDHVDRERRLQLRQLEQVVHHDVGVAIALERDDQLSLATVRAIVDIGNSVEVTVVDQLLDASSNGRARGLVRQLGDDDLVPTVFTLFD